MSEQEVELYLSLLTNLLRLRPDQRSAITDELRDHLEERIAELKKAGLTTEVAARLAVEEMGDAVGLARNLMVPNTRQRRRQALRYSVGSALVVVVTFVMASFYWPTQRPEETRRLVAQYVPPTRVNQPAKPAPPAQHEPQPPANVPGDGAAVVAANPRGKVPAAFTTQEDRRLQVEAALDEPLTESLNLENVPIRDSIDQLAHRWNLRIMFRVAKIRDAGIDLDLKWNGLKFPDGNDPITRRQAFDELLLNAELDYLVMPGMVIVTSRQDANEQIETRVYDCRDLLSLPDVDHPALMGGYQTTAYGPAVMGRAHAIQTVQFGGMAGAGGAAGAGMGAGGMPAGGAGGMGGRGMAAAKTPEAKLRELIMDTCEEGQSNVSNDLAVKEFKGLLVIRQTQRLHREIETLLARLRLAANAIERPGVQPQPQLEHHTGMNSVHQY